MEEYTEKQVLEQVEKDLSGGVFSPESIYMRKDLLAKDTGRSLEDITEVDRKIFTWILKIRKG